MESVTEIRATLTEHKVIQEMIETERTFNTSLAFLSDILSKDELVKDIGVLLQFRTIVEQLQDISDKLLANVIDAMSIKDDPSTRNKLKEQRTGLLKLFFQLYPTCTNLYTEYAQLAGANKELFQEIDKYTSRNNTNRLDLQGFLIQPVQRGPRYAMLIAAAISYNAKLLDNDEAKLSEEKVLDLTKLLEVVQAQLIDANTKTAKLDVKPFELSDIPGMIINYFQEPAVTTVSEQPVTRGYRIGDGSRAVYSWLQNRRATQAFSLPTIAEETDLVSDKLEEDCTGDSQEPEAAPEVAPVHPSSAQPSATQGYSLSSTFYSMWPSRGVAAQPASLTTIAEDTNSEAADPDAGILGDFVILPESKQFS
ncbi:RhoGEF domain protein [Legionella massiliensis]|uniref:RhoGEF domain protein n=1 Tax=Legionella massiliensis TaxID=1034943 RepID=A0A078L213_9GAMM|nr:RhoGEF domain-containing protein [Legionella massiliensis]CDZ79226.1 RhoGEF domain protein [Legionella massiliensis]CEE14964.1 RhoGEF domain protein [Legionella massiliensis]